MKNKRIWDEEQEENKDNMNIKKENFKMNLEDDGLMGYGTL
jgi:hypothetical protein